jgi:hypothetical protein
MEFIFVIIVIIATLCAVLGFAGLRMAQSTSAAWYCGSAAGFLFLYDVVASPDSV